MKNNLIGFVAEKMRHHDTLRYFRKMYRHVKKYPRLAFWVLALSLIASVLEGFSIGALIPLIQLVGHDTLTLNNLIPFWDRLTPLHQLRFSPLTTILCLIFVLIVLRSLVHYWYIIFIHRITTRIRRDLQVELFDKLTSTHVAFFHFTKTGQVAATLQNYTEEIASSIFTTLHLTLIVTRLLVYLVVLALISYKVTFTIVGLAVLAIPGVIWILRRLRDISATTVKAAAQMQTHIQELFSGITLMKIFGMEEHERARFKKIADQIADVHIQAARYLNLITPWSEVLLAALIIGALVITLRVWHVDVASNLSFLLTYAYVFFRFFEQGNAILSGISKITHGSGHLKAYDRLMTKAQQHPQPTGIKRLGKLHHGIWLNNVSFAYTPSQPILHHISFHIPRGRMVALVGPSGSGKTTIANLVSGLYEPTDGAITVDDISMRDLDHHDWRSHIGYIAQETTIFNNTIQNNIRYGHPTASYEQVVAACQAAHIHDFVQSLPEQYDTVVGERGVRLSGGQRQRLAIARALIREPEIIIMDEATSSLDAATENEIQKSLQALFTTRTALVIAHRLATITRADNIILIHQGQLLDQGTHQELKARNHLYQYLCELQFTN
jgi:ABC-type multidrug transport system fused ATPase/permease subunit